MKYNNNNNNNVLDDIFVFSFVIICVPLKGSPNN